MTVIQLKACKGTASSHATAYIYASSPFYLFSLPSSRTLSHPTPPLPTSHFISSPKMPSPKPLLTLIALLSSTALALPRSQLSKRYNPYVGKPVDYWKIYQSGNNHLRPLDDDWAAKLPVTEYNRPITNCTFTQEIPYGDMIDGAVIYRGSIFTW